jgi:phosphohistidine phosphatase
MKALHLLRHAKSAWDNPGLSDRDRPLNKRGRGDAPRIGKALAKSLVAMPVAVSPARRAQLTLEGLCAGWPELAEVTHRTEEDLYTFSHDAVADWIALQDDDLEALFLIGHNPAFTDLVNALVGEHCLDNLPTAGYAELVLEIDRWRDLAPSCGSLSRTIFPRQLPED